MTRPCRLAALAVCFGIVSLAHAVVTPGSERALRAAVAAVPAEGYATIAITTPLALTGSLTVPANVVLRFADGGQLITPAGKTLRLEGSLDAPYQRLFRGAGRVELDANRIREIVPQWFGAWGDGRRDDTAALQAAIDALPARFETSPEAQRASGGVVYLPPGRYRVTRTVTAVSGLTLRGAGPQASVILYGAAAGACLKLPADCSWFRLEELGMRGRPPNTAVAVDGTTPYVRYPTFRRFQIIGFHSGIVIWQGMHISVSEGYLGCYGLGEANGTVDLQLGDRAQDKACTTATVQDVYLTNAETCLYNNAAPCLLLRPIFESCSVGFKSFCRAALIEPFFAGCKVDAQLTANGVLFVGPFPTEHKIEYSDPAMQMRTSFLPDTFDTLMKLGRMELSATGKLTLDGKSLSR